MQSTTSTALPSRLSLLPSTLVSTSAPNSHGTSTLISQRKHLRPSTSSEETSQAAQSMSNVKKHLWDLSWSTHHQYGTTASNATSTKSTRFSGMLHVSPVVITDGHLGCQPCCRSCSGIHSNKDELASWSWCCTESETVSSPYPLQLTLNQFLSAQEGSKQDMCRFSAIQPHMVRPSFMHAMLRSVTQCIMMCCEYFAHSQKQAYIICWMSVTKLSRDVGREIESAAADDNSQLCWVTAIIYWHFEPSLCF